MTGLFFARSSWGQEASGASWRACRPGENAPATPQMSARSCSASPGPGLDPPTWKAGGAPGGASWGDTGTKLRNRGSDLRVARGCEEGRVPLCPPPSPPPAPRLSSTRALGQREANSI